MCEFHSCIVALKNDGDVVIYHGATKTKICNHHHIIAEAAGLTDEMYQAKLWLRHECKPETKYKVELDEVGDMPQWYLDNRKDIGRRVRSLARSAKKVDKALGPALAEYEKVTGAARAEYQKVRGPARAEYEKVRDAAWAEYEKVTGAAWAEYEKVRDAIINERLAPLETFVWVKDE